MPKRTHSTEPRYCLICKKIIERPFRGKSKFYIGWGQYQKRKFCSNKCKGKWTATNNTGKNNYHWKGGVPNCIDCGNKLGKGTYHKIGINKRCLSCWHKLLREHPESHPNWKGGKNIDKSGYVLIYNPNHQFSNALGYIREHRLIAEKCLGRNLTKREVIHHINGVKNDNRPENLYLFKSDKEHRINENKVMISNLIW